MFSIFKIIIDNNILVIVFLVIVEFEVYIEIYKYL